MNTNKLKATFLLAALAVLFTACEKEENDLDVNASNPSANSKNASINQKNYNPTSTITVENGMLQFLSIDHFIETEYYLNNQLDIWDDAFLNLYGHLDDDSLASVEDSLNYNEDQPLVNLENSLNFNSLRKLIVTQEDAWLENDGEDINLDPDNHYITDDVIRTLLNEYAEVKIDSSIFIMLELATVQIVNGSLLSLDSVRNATDITSVISSNIKLIDEPINLGKTSLIGGTHKADCGASLKRKADKETIGKNRIKWVISVWTHPWDCGPIAKTKNYKKKKGKWKKRRAYISAEVSGKMVDASCSEHNVFDIKQKRRKKVKTARPGDLCKTKRYLIRGVHTSPNITYLSTLTW